MVGLDGRLDALFANILRYGSISGRTRTRASAAVLPTETNAASSSFRRGLDGRWLFVPGAWPLFSASGSAALPVRVHVHAQGTVLDGRACLSAPVSLQGWHSRRTRTCCGMPAGSPWSTKGRIPGRCRPTWATEHPAHRALHRAYGHAVQEFVAMSSKATGLGSFGSALRRGTVIAPSVRTEPDCARAGTR